MEAWQRTVTAGMLLLGVAGSPLAQDTSPPIGLEVGLTAPAFALPDLAGNLHSLAQHRGEVVLVNFWSTWCAPCRTEMPDLQALYETYRERGFTVLAVNLNLDGHEPVEAFVAELRLTFPILLNPRKDVGRAYRVFAIPASFLLDRQGRIAHRRVGDPAWDQPQTRALVERLLAAP
ncbi:MAG: TlpA family protein disulfide reductase [candidate division NC10 bacterium]|nr:TlpA family protein disulfide reductase [candidate division NC10 bacterium]